MLNFGSVSTSSGKDAVVFDCLLHFPNFINSIDIYLPYKS